MLLLDLLFPPRCVGCARGGHWFCPVCVAAIAPAPAWKEGLEPLAGLWVAGLYEDPLRTAIHALKYEGKRQVAGPLGRLLVATYRSQNAGDTRMRFDALLPVPLHPKRQAERGYNQSALLARRLARGVGVPIVEDALRRSRNTPQQAGLEGTKRRANVAGAFACEPGHPALVGRRLLLVDDVCATGATLAACAWALRAAGAREVWGLTLARPALYPDA
ncbi:MAG TPA: ComF family protein [Ktedonobacterales bacterium]|jgi:ComF family protein